MSDEDLNAKLRALVQQELGSAMDALKRELLAELRPSEGAAAAPDPGPRISALNAVVNPPSGDRLLPQDEDAPRVSTRGGMHVYGPRVAAEHANFAAPVAMPQAMPEVRSGEHANFAPQVNLRGPLAPAPVVIEAHGGVHSVVDGHANFAAVPHRWVGLGPDRYPPAVQLILPDGTQVTLPRGARGPFRVGDYIFAGLETPEEAP